ncbi:MAG: CsbD family protein [Cuspidothrix sp.]
MSMKNRAKATAKNVEGKVQEAIGDLTGDPKTQAEGKEKQAEAKIRHAVEDVKDQAREVMEYIQRAG